MMDFVFQQHTQYSVRCSHTIGSACLHENLRDVCYSPQANTPRNVNGVLFRRRVVNDSWYLTHHFRSKSQQSRPRICYMARGKSIVVSKKVPCSYCSIQTIQYNLPLKITFAVIERSLVSFSFITANFGHDIGAKIHSLS